MLPLLAPSYRISRVLLHSVFFVFYLRYYLEADHSLTLSHDKNCVAIFIANIKTFKIQRHMNAIIVRNLYLINMLRFLYNVPLKNAACFVYLFVNIADILV